MPTDIEKAVQHHQRGELQQAEALYRQVLQSDPEDINALHLLGVLALQAGNCEPAIALIEKAISLQPGTAVFHNNLGNALALAQRLEEAIGHFHQAIQLEPAYYDAYNNLGIALKNTGQLEAAMAAYQEALRQKPDYANAWHNLGHARKAQGDFTQALKSYQQALVLSPRDPEIYRSLGILFQETEQGATAETYFRQALQLNPSMPNIHHDLAISLQSQKQWEAARQFFDLALQSGPGARLYNNLGLLHQELQEYEQALGYLRQCLDLQPDYAEAWFNLANIERDTGGIQQAIAHYEQALVLNPNYADAHHNLSLVWLLTGNYRQGFPAYEWRWTQKENPVRHFQQPAWEGGDLNGKRILVYAEQGLGDTIQFIRYAPLLAGRGGLVQVECAPALVPLLKTVAGIDSVTAAGDPLPNFDVHVAMLSLPALFRTTVETVPGEVPYVGVAGRVTPPSPLLTRGGATGDKGLRRIGFVWAGNPHNRDDFKRSCPLEYWRPLFELPGIEWFSLQVGERSEELYRPHPVSPPDSQASPSTPASASPPLAKRGPGGVPAIIDLSPAIQDFADTAAIISQVDLIITVDTAVAHLAGAMAKPVWILLSYIPDWRWMLNRPDSPWYPTATLFRQPAHGDWESVIELVREQLLGEWDKLELPLRKNRADP